MADPIEAQATAQRSRPFHLAVLVRDLGSTRRFYGELLGCREGRSTASWVDFDFFGNQLSAHLSEVPPQQVPCGKVDAVVVPIPHFGAILEWDEFGRVAERLRAAGAHFTIAPSVRYAGLKEEQATLFVNDASGNAIELKAFRDPARVFAP